MAGKYEEKSARVVEEKDTQEAVDDTHLDVEGVLQKGTKRDLQARHLQMIAIGGTIGTGLFLKSGGSIASAGPAGAFIAYLLIGIMVFCVMTGLGEVATYMPTSGAFTHYATRFVDPAFGFAVGWNYWFSWSITIGTELSAAAAIIAYWDQDGRMPPGALCAIFLVFLFFLNVFGVRGFGEAEYWFSLLKVVTVILFILVAILVDAGAVGNPRTVFGVRNWAKPFPNGFGGFLQTLLGVSFAYQGTELVGITAGESRNPRRNVPRAINNVFWRILLFYCVSIFLEGCILDASDPRLSGAHTVAVAPFTIIFQDAFGSGAAGFINAVILTSVLSAGNSGMYASSRTIMALAREKKAPAIFGKTTKYGVPFYSICLSTLMGLLSLLTLNDTANEVFTWLSNITGTAGFVSWMSIAISHYYFRRAYVAQNRDIKDLPYRAIGYPYTDLFAIVFICIVVFFQGYATLSPFSPVDFISNYIGIVPFVVAIVGYKVIIRPHAVKPEEADLDTGRCEHYEEELEDEERDIDSRWYMKLYNFVV